MKLLLLTLILSSNYLIDGKPEPGSIYDWNDEKSDNDDSESGWWSAITSSFSSWNTPEEESNDNEEEIRGSVKLIEMFPYLQEKLDSTNEEEKQEAEEFIKSMHEEIKQKKRYTHMFWNGMRRIIDMGKLESTERRSNEEKTFWLFDLIGRFIDWVKSFFSGSSSNDDKKDTKSENKNATAEKKPTETKKSTNDEKTAKSDEEKNKQNNSDSKTKGEQDHVRYPVTLSHTPPPSNPTIAVKNEQDRLAREQYVMDSQKKPENQNELVSHTATHPQTPSPNIPDIASKDEIDKSVSSANESNPPSVHTDAEVKSSEPEVRASGFVVGWNKVEGHSSGTEANLSKIENAPSGQNIPSQVPKSGVIADNIEMHSSGVDTKVHSTGMETKVIQSQEIRSHGETKDQGNEVDQASALLPKQVKGEPPQPSANGVEKQMSEDEKNKLTQTT